MTFYYHTSANHAIQENSRILRDRLISGFRDRLIPGSPALCQLSVTDTAFLNNLSQNSEQMCLTLFLLFIKLTAQVERTKVDAIMRIK